MPAGDHSSVSLVATAYNGPVSGEITVGYTDGTTESRPITVPDWCNPLAGSTVLLSMPHRIRAGQGVDAPATNLYGISFPVAAGKQIRSLTLPDDQRINLYALTLR